MFLNISSAPMLSVSALTPNDLSSGRAGGGGAFFLGGCGAGCETVRVFWEMGLVFSVRSGTVPTVFFLPNQLLLFLRDSVGAWLLMVAGEPGRSDLRLSLEGIERRPKYFRTDELRTDEGRCEGLAGDKVLPATSLVRLSCSCASVAGSPCALPFVASCCGKTPETGVGCDDNGPFPGVGGRGESGGESGGAGIEVPSVREKLMGVNVSGWYLPTAMADVVGRDSVAPSQSEDNCLRARK
jgi:hypothetical protein